MGAPAQPGYLAMDGLAGAFSRSGIGGNRSFPPKTLALRLVLPVSAMADRPATRLRAAACPRQAPRHRPVSRPGVGHRPFRLGSLGAPRRFRARLPRGLASGRFLTQGAGLGVPAAPLRT